MKRANSSKARSTGSSEASQPHLLCAYSPRWLSGPTPGYEGLCPTWAEDDADTAEHEAITVS